MTYMVAACRSGNGVGRIDEVTLRRAHLVLGIKGDRLLVGKPPRYAASHPGQLSLLPYTGRKMSTSQSAMMLCGWGVKAGMAHSTCG